MSDHNNEQTPNTREWTEEIEVAANQVIETVQSLIREGNVRRLIIKYDGNPILEVPVTLAAIAGLATLYMAPLLAALGALAGLVARVQVVIEREGERPPEPVDVTPSETRAIPMDPTLSTEPLNLDDLTETRV